MDELFVRNLVFFGIHGLYRREKNVAQRFRVSARCQVDTKTVRTSDKIKDTLDYRKIAGCIEKVIAGPPVNMLEKLADTIASKLLTFRNVKSASVTIEKLDVFTNGVPGVTIYRRSK
jgi:dihydroneopterin aldolase